MSITQPLKFLCPDVEETCTDPARNKLLQLVGLFGTTYDRTIAARENGHSREESDAWFEAQLAPWDYRGRTALHVAAAGRSPECVAVVLERNPDVATVTFGEENTALHTAVRLGVPESVRLILEEFPGLAAKANAAEQTPFEMAREIIENLPDWQSFMRKENRQTGSKADFEAIAAMLEPDRV